MGPRGIRLPADDSVPKNVSLVGSLNGPFVDFQTGKVVNTFVILGDATSEQYGMIKGAIYQVNAVARSTSTSLYGLEVGSTKNQNAYGLGLGQNTPLGVALSDAAKAIYILGDIEATTLLQKGAGWKVATKAQTIAPSPFAKTEVARNGVTVRSAMGGKWVKPNAPAQAQGEDRFIFKTLDGLAKERYGLLAATYGFDALFTDGHSAPQMYGATLGVPPTQFLLSADVDTPQRAMSLHGLVQGKRFVQAGGLGWGVSNEAFKVVPDPRFSDISFGNQSSREKRWQRVTQTVPTANSGLRPTSPNVPSLPPLQASGKVVVRANAQTVPQATPTAQASATPRPSPTPTSQTVSDVTFEGISS